jgi:outer membrane protein OmpA-like peptidoglycan-associated protein
VNLSAFKILVGIAVILSVSGCGTRKVVEADVAAVIGAPVGGQRGKTIADVMEQARKDIAAALPYIGAETVNKGEVLVITVNTNRLFTDNSNVLTDEATHLLRSITSTLKNIPDAGIFITGYTDNTGEPTLNRTLSEKRAVSIKNYLGKHGFSERQISCDGEGSGRPVADNKTEAGRNINRRIEILVYKRL